MYDCYNNRRGGLGVAVSISRKRIVQAKLCSVSLRNLPRQHNGRFTEKEGCRQAQGQALPPQDLRHGRRCHQGPEGEIRLIPARHQEVHRCQLQGRCGQTCSLYPQSPEEGSREQEACPGQGQLQAQQGGTQKEGRPQEEGRCQEASRQKAKDPQEEGRSQEGQEPEEGCTQEGKDPKEGPGQEASCKEAGSKEARGQETRQEGSQKARQEVNQHSRVRPFLIH